MVNMPLLLPRTHPSAELQALASIAASAHHVLVGYAEIVAGCGTRALMCIKVAVRVPLSEAVLLAWHSIAKPELLRRGENLL
jgi:hypothetical protein